MPYRFRITTEEVEKELEKMGFENVPQETLENFRRDLMKMIKEDIKKIRKQKSSEEMLSLSSDFDSYKIKSKYRNEPHTSTPQSCSEDGRMSDSGLSTTSSCSSSSSKAVSSASSSQSADSSVQRKTSDLPTRASDKVDAVPIKTKKKPKIKPQDAEAPSYPEKPDPVNLYHYYKAFWDKYKIPGEDPRKALRWEIRTNLFHAS